MKTRLLFVIESLGGGGAEKVLATLLKHINRDVFEVTLCPIVDTGKYVEEVRPYVNYKPILPDPQSLSVLGRLWYNIKYKLIYKWLPMSCVYRLWVPKNHDVEIAFCEGFATKLISASTNRAAKHIAWIHIDLKCNPWPQRQGFFKNTAEETLAYERFDKIITVSQTVEESIKEVYGLHSKITTIYNPIDVEDIKIKAQEGLSSRSSLNVDGLKSTHLVAVGRLVHQKGYDILLQVVSRLRNDGYNFTLSILGEGGQRSELESYIKENDLQDRVELLGFHRNPYPYIVQSDLFVCSSRSEGYSLVIAEALVLGKPVISTYCSGPNELLGEGKYGMLVSNDESGDGLYNGLKTILDNPEILDGYQQAAQVRSSDFSLSSTMQKIEETFSQTDY